MGQRRRIQMVAFPQGTGRQEGNDAENPAIRGRAHRFALPEPPGSGYIMSVGTGGWSEEERSLAQLAYRVGPNVRYPGLVREEAEDGAGEDHSDRAALTALYDATGGENRDDSANWGTDEPFEHWYGVVGLVRLCGAPRSRIKPRGRLGIFQVVLTPTFCRSLHRTRRPILGARTRWPTTRRAPELSQGVRPGGASRI